MTEERPVQGFKQLQPFYPVTKRPKRRTLHEELNQERGFISRAFSRVMTAFAARDQRIARTEAAVSSVRDLSDPAIRSNLDAGYRPQLSLARRTFTDDTGLTRTVTNAFEPIFHLNTIPLDWDDARTFLQGLSSVSLADNSRNTHFEISKPGIYKLTLHAWVNPAAAITGPDLPAIHVRWKVGDKTTPSRSSVFEDQVSVSIHLYDYIEVTESDFFLPDGSPAVVDIFSQWSGDGTAEFPHDFDIRYLCEEVEYLGESVIEA